jgi:phosphate transport system ATP-binding protein
VKSDLLVFKDFGIVRNGQPLLKNISVTVRSMEILSVIGPKGSGKGLWVKSLLGIHKGDTTGSFEKIGSQKLGLVSSNYPCIDHLSIFTNLSLVSRMAGVDMQAHLAEEVEDVLKKVRLWSALKNNLHDNLSQLSSFQKILLNLARTLLLKPTVLILDQPTKNLDPVQKATYESVIEQIKDSVGVIWINHDLEQVARVSDQVLYLDKGQMIECDTCEVFFTMPKHQESENYISGRIYVEI